MRDLQFSIVSRDFPWRGNFQPLVNFSVFLSSNIQFFFPAFCEGFFQMLAVSSTSYPTFALFCFDTSHHTGTTEFSNTTTSAHTSSIPIDYLFLEDEFVIHFQPGGYIDAQELKSPSHPSRLRLNRQKGCLRRAAKQNGLSLLTTTSSFWTVDQIAKSTLFQRHRDKRQRAQKPNEER